MDAAQGTDSTQQQAEGPAFFRKHMIPRWLTKTLNAEFKDYNSSFPSSLFYRNIGRQELHLISTHTIEKGVF